MKHGLIKVFLIIIIIGYWNNLRAEVIAVKPPDNQGRLVTLSGGIQIVLKDNRLIKIALPDNEMAYQDSLMARSALLPRL